MKLTWICALTGFALVSCQSMLSRGPTESDRLNDFFEEVFQAELATDPEWMSYLGMQDRAGEWSDRSDAFEEAALERKRGALARMEAEFHYDQLDPSAQLSYRLFAYQVEREEEAAQWRKHNYPVHQMRGGHTRGPTLLLNVHRIDTVEDAENYVRRMETMDDMLGQVMQGLTEREALGVLPPAFVFPKVIQDCRNVVSGEPFNGTTPSILWADFTGKLEGVADLSDARRRDLLRRAELALLEDVGPAYQGLITLLEDQQTRATSEDGVWKLPQGSDYYEYCLARHTTTTLKPDEIHNRGLQEVARIHGEMEAIASQVGFEGTLREFFEHLRVDPRYYYENTEEGKAAYLAEATALIDTMRGRLRDVFNTLPKASIEVRAVEPYREKSTGKAFYSAPAPDGSRPGVYYANLYNMADMPKYQMEALAYHEGIPGHHMQIAIAQELEGVPQFRKFGGYTAYSEGWGLYTEWLPKEMGFYSDPYSDFGRLAMELWRACRLVVDTGMHQKKWSRDRAIQYLKENTPNPEGDCIKAIERYIVMPGQATAYKVGMMHIMELRGEAEATLGSKFDVRAFHDVLLRGGSVPLEVLTERVHDWMESEGAPAAKTPAQGSDV